MIDWDDVYSLPWIHDIAELTFWLKREYGSESEIYRNAFLNNYQTEYDMSDFYNIEPVLHARIGLGGLNHFIGKPQEKMIKQLMKESLEKCGMRALKCLLTSIEIRYIPHGKITKKQQQDVDFINEICLSDESDEDVEFDESTYEYSAPEDGIFLLFDDDRVVGRAAVHKVLTEYDGQEYYLGGFGGLAVLPLYQGKGYARKLAEAALKKANEIGIDIVCMEANIESGITKFYEELGFVFLNRPAYFINHDNNEVTDDNVMVMGLRNKELADKILTTGHKFHYGKSLGHW